MDHQNDDIDAWRRVHRQLTMAIVQSRNNIAAELTKRRYLLEEMNRCKMQHTTAAGVARGPTKKKAAPRKAAPPKKATGTAYKVKMPQVSGVAKFVHNHGNKVSETAKLPTPTATEDVLNPTNAQFTGLTPAQISQMYSQPPLMGMYGNMIPATQEQINLAFQMMETMNQNSLAATEEGDDDDDDSDDKSSE